MVVSHTLLDPQACSHFKVPIDPTYIKLTWLCTCRRCQIIMTVHCSQNCCASLRLSYVYIALFTVVNRINLTNVHHGPENDHRPRNICHGADETNGESYDGEWYDLFTSSRAPTGARRCRKLVKWRYRIFCRLPTRVAAIHAGAATKSLSKSTKKNPHFHSGTTKTEKFWAKQYKQNMLGKQQCFTRFSNLTDSNPYH